jgi:hypothetical protein
LKITFIRPNMMPVRGADAMEPLVFAILAGLKPPHVVCSTCGYYRGRQVRPVADEG